ncbi:hypothetical protein E05_26970 [Plautia stali symbiont]|nr:hypothetical protein E05_26970 [Plautia stali symbiont]
MVLLVMIGFNLFFSPVVPLSDALAATWTQQIGLAYGPVRLWGSLAFVISSALTGMLVSAWSSQVILLLLSAGALAMLSGVCALGSLDAAGRQHCATAVDCGADSALRQLYRLPSGGDVLDRRA